jgi:MYXO-CTERM domain-containing protein
MHDFDPPPSLRLRRIMARAVIAPGLASLGLLLVPGSARAGGPVLVVVPGNIVLQEGVDPGGGAPVVDMNPPFVNAAGEVSFSGLLEDGDHYVFVGNAVVWEGSDDAMSVLTDLELRMDSSGMGGFVYPIDIDGADALYTDAGPFAAAGDPIPPLMGSTYTFLGNPSMNGDGAIHFVGGIDDDGDGIVDRYALMRTLDGTPASVEVVYAGDDMVDMVTLVFDGIDLDYSVSEDGTHLGTILYATGDPLVDAYVRIDDMFVAHELDPTGDGDNWDNFDLIAVNAGGNYVFTGDTDGPTGTDEFLAYNATVVVREGDNIGGIDLPAGSSMRFAALSDLDQAAFAWARPTNMGVRETVFFTCDTNDFPGQTQEVFTTVDTQLDVDGDEIGDYTILDITIGDAFVGKAIGETPFVYAEVLLADAMGVQTDAMIEVPVSCCGNGAVNPFEECDDANAEDTDDCLSTCVAASCGDGFIQDGVEACDDGNDDDTDDCPTSCVSASCGDGFVQDGVEECDDGNEDDTDDCVSGCVAATCGDGLEADCTLPGGVDESGTTMGGVDDTGDSGGGSGGGSGGPVSLSGADTLEGSDSTGETETDSAGGVDMDDGCNCTTGHRHAWGGAAWSLLGLGLLGLGRRRRGR